MREPRSGERRPYGPDSTPILNRSQSMEADPLHTKRRGVRRRLGGSVGDTSNSGDHRQTSSHHSYVRIRPSSKTGGYVGSVDSGHNVAYYCDDSTVGAANTVQSSPELFARSRRHESQSTERRDKRLFRIGGYPQPPTQQQPSNKPISFLERWKNLGRGKGAIPASSRRAGQGGATPGSGVAASAAAPSQSTGATAFVLQPTRGVSHSVTTPIRSNTAPPLPRFILPDETPPSPTTTRPFRPKGGSISSQDQTSAGAVVHQPVDEQPQQGFEMTIAKPGPPLLPELPPLSVPLTSTRRRSSHPIDLDDTYSSDEDEALVRSWVDRLALTNEKLLVETCCSGGAYGADDELDGPNSDADVASIAANPTLPPAPSDIDINESPTKTSNVFQSVGSMLLPKRIKDKRSDVEESDNLVDDDVTEFSLAPLHTTQHQDITTTASKRPPSKIGTRKRYRAPAAVVNPQRRNHGLGMFPRLRRRDTTSVTAVALLERERLAAMESETKRQFLERQELLRIEQKRRDYLTQQRARERDQPQNVSAAQRESIFVSMELVEQDSQKVKPSSTRRQRTQHGTTLTQSTAPTTDTSKISVGAVTLPACVVCGADHRTHIATPCMHFAYCEKCARRLSTSGRGCFVCGRPDVTFAAVSV